MKALILFFLFIFINCIICVEDEKCSYGTDCKMCMGVSPTCSWCFDSKYNDKNIGPGYRCASAKTLMERECPKESIEFVKSENSSISRIKREASKDETQLKPVTQDISIRPGMPLDINLRYEAIGDYPVDLYYLTDLSYSMKDDLETVSNMTKTIATELGKLTKKLRMGFGGFVDKPVFPFVNPSPAALKNPCINLGEGSNEMCDPPFLYKHILPLTSNISEFQAKTRQTTPSGNLDSPEGGLDALLQVAYCDRFVKWDSKARKIVLFTSDGGFHVAGDGRLAGLIKPPPRQCEINNQTDRFNSKLFYLGWHNSIETDYPSVGEVASVLKEKSISVIFATNKENKLLYERLSEFLPSAAVGVIEKSSSNIVELLKENYRKIISKVDLAAQFNDTLLDVKILTKCAGDTDYSEKSRCEKNPVNGKIEYTLKVNTKKCFDGNAELKLQISGLKDSATINVKSACECAKCKAQPEIPDSEQCNKRGKFHCGSCTCNKGFSGDFCECDSETKNDETKTCIKPGEKEVCSGRGRCKCGTCKCSLTRYTGKYCDCDTQGCPRATDDNFVCGGSERGTCQCDGKCKCKTGYRGNACDCLESNSHCIDPKNKTAPLCHNRGQCDCGYCFCNPPYAGEQCQSITDDNKMRCSRDNDKVLTNCMLCLYEGLVKDDKSIYKLTSNKVPILPTSFDNIDSSISISGSGAVKNNNNSTLCSQECSSVNVDRSKLRLIGQVDREEGSEVCVIYNKDGCTIYVYYRPSDDIYTNRKILMSFQMEKECPDTRSLIILIISVILAIVILGLFLLLIWKLVVTIDDRRENAIYQEQLKNAKWETEENPIFKPPVTTVRNPLYTGGDD